MAKKKRSLPSQKSMPVMPRPQAQPMDMGMQSMGNPTSMIPPMQNSSSFAPTGTPPPTTMPIKGIKIPPKGKGKKSKGKKGKK